MAEPVFYPRYSQRRLIETLEDSPVVLIHGPRQCGKTTLAQFMCAPEHLSSGKIVVSRYNHPVGAGTFDGYEYVSFDDRGVREIAKDDPVGFVARLPKRVILDEVQYTPEIFSAIKMEVDRNRVPGRFIMTGSANVLLVPALSDSLAGRMQIVQLYPLAQCELERQSSGFLDALFEHGFDVRRTERLGAEIAERVVSGGYPAALARTSGRRRSSWYRDHVNIQIKKDINELARISMLDSLPKLMTLASERTANLFNASDLSSPFHLSRTTIRDYLKLLEMIFLLERLPPWYSNRQSRLVKTPKLHIGDTGIACALMGVTAAGLYENRPLLGQLLETFVFHELQRQASWHDDFMSFYHYREKNGPEVDIVIERGALHVAGIEVKASGTVTKSDFRGLRKLQKVAGDRFVAGVVLYDGDISIGFGDGLYAVPLRMLWETP